MGIYDDEWRSKPAGYYADNKVKNRFHKRQREEQEFRKLVEEILERMGYETHEIPEPEDVKEAENKAREILQ